MENASEDEHPETLRTILSLADYETPNLKLCAKSFDFVMTTVIEGGYIDTNDFRRIMDEIPIEVFVLSLGNPDGEDFVNQWLINNGIYREQENQEQLRDSCDSSGNNFHDDTPTYEFLELTRFYFQPKVNVLSSAVRSGQLNLYTSKFILSYLFGDKTSSWVYYELNCRYVEDDDSEDSNYDVDKYLVDNYDGTNETYFKIQWDNISSYMDHMVFDFYKKPTACIKL
jgi:hypothetical protein